jgi:hypothetical protein
MIIRMLGNSDENSALEYLCTLNLVMTMFRLTSQDLKYGDEESKTEAKKFLKSAWFNELCNDMGLDTNRVRKIIVENQRIGSRASYE